MSRESKIAFYINKLQGHPTPAVINKFPDYENLGLPFNKGDKILCVGAADGHELRKLNELGYVTTGITLGKTNKAYQEEHFPEVDLRLMDMHDLKFPCGYFDGIYSSHSFEHSFAPMIHVLEVWSVLKPDGYWYMKHPYMDNMSDGEAHWVSYHHPNVNSVEYHRNLFLACSFHITEFIRDDVEEEDIWIIQKKMFDDDVHSSVRECLLDRIEYEFDFS